MVIHYTAVFLLNYVAVICLEITTLSSVALAQVHCRLEIPLSNSVLLYAQRPIMETHHQIYVFSNAILQIICMPTT